MNTSTNEHRKNKLLVHLTTGTKMKIIFELFFIFIISSFCFGQIVNFHDEETAKCGQHYFDPTTNSDFKNQDIKYKWGIAFKNGKAIYFDHQKMTGADFFPYPNPKYSKKTKRKILIHSYLIMESANYLRVLDTKVDDPFTALDEGQKIYCMKIENYKMFLKDEKSDWEPMTITFKGEIKSGKNYYGEDTLCKCLLFNIKTKWFEGNYEYVCEPDSSENAGTERLSQPATPFPTLEVIAHPVFDKLTAKIEEQINLICMDQRSRKITDDQSKTAMNRTKAIYKQMRNNMKANANKDLTLEQENKIKSAIDANRKSL